MSGSWMRSAIGFPLGLGLPTRSAKASMVIWLGLPSRIRTIVAPGIAGALMAAASRADMPANMALMGIRTASSSGVAALRTGMTVQAATVINESIRVEIFIGDDCRLR